MKLSRSEPCVLLISPGIIKWTDADFGLPHLVSIGSYLEAELGARVEILDLGIVACQILTRSFCDPRDVRHIRT